MDQQSPQGWLTTRFGLNRGSPGGGAPLGFTTSVKTFTSWLSPFPTASAFSSTYSLCGRTLETKYDRIRGERSPFVVCHDNVLRITNDVTRTLSRTEFCGTPCSAQARHKGVVLLRTKSERQICALGPNAYSVKEEVTSVPANLCRLVSTLTFVLKYTSDLCTGLSGLWCPTASEMWGISG
jgi:hypothetical protein